MPAKKLSSLILYGACYGALTWLAYAQTEYLLCTLVPLRFEAFTLPISHWQWTAIVFGCYAAVGVILGAIFGAAVQFYKSRRAEAKPGDAMTGAVLAFLAVYFAWLIASGTWQSGSGLPGAVLCIALAAGLIRNLQTPLVSGWRTMLATPWTAPLLLLCPFKLCDFGRAHSPLAIWSIFAGWAAAAWIAMWLTARVRHDFAVPAATALLARRTAVLAISTAVFFAASALWSRGLPPMPQRAAAAAGSRPNVVLVIWDTVRADRESVYGYGRDTTPFLRQYARGATLYKDAFSASDMTLSSSASIFTGLYASWHGAHFSRVSPYGRPLDKKFHTIAQLLNSAGYTTMAVLANCSYLSPGYQMNHGFQLYDVRTPVGSDAVDQSYYLRAPLHKILGRFTSAGELDRRFRRGDAITQDALRLLHDARKGGPFFLALNYMDAHLPYIPPPPYDTLFPGKDPSLTFADLEHLRKEVLELKRMPTPAEAAHITSQYDGGIAFLDSQFRMLVEGLKQLGLYDSTLIVLTGDHGEALGDRHMMEHAVSVYQDQVHVPLIVKYPGQTESSVVTAPVSGIDILPTILDVAGLPPSTQAQGRTLRQPDPARTVISESFRSGLLVNWHPRFDRIERSIVRGNMKLIQSTSGKNELYNLSADPKEANNLYHTDYSAASDLDHSLKAMLVSAPAAHAPAHTMDRQSLDRLRSLGYVQ